jgi:primosomal protein N' (replication factor Y)
MYYYHIWVRSNRYHGSEPLTYSSNDILPIGTVIQIELQNTVVLGFISGQSTNVPKFKTKPILEVYDLPPIPQHLIKLLNWLKEYYPAPMGVLAGQLLPPKLTLKQIDSLEIPAVEPFDLNNLPKLNKEQSDALERINRPNTYVLHGITGSGKTRVYLELTAKIIQANKSAIILTPEISLTSQLGNTFKNVFGSRVIVMHSKQTPLERQISWLTCLKAEAEPLIVIGPRSALFAPLSNPGLIILDESHEGAYKQEQLPQYQTGRVASYLSNLTRSILLLGSATPSVSDYYLAQQKDKPIVKLTSIANSSDRTKTEITIIDRKDNGQFSRSPYFSNAMIGTVEKALSNSEQSLLYLNRRGTAKLVLCENCGWQATCPNCDVPLTYHGDKHEMRCHSCNYHTSAPSFCPVCGSADVVFKTAGTKAIVDEAQRIFNNARISRFDTDNNKSESFEQNYERAKNGDIDILIGTQMLAKGLDLPNLSTVGVLLADTSLYIPDFSSQERTFQLINQVLGRVGRGHIAGHAVIQTFHPDHPILRFAINSDYEGFYESELTSREKYLFPPFCYLLKLSVRRASIKSAETAAEKFKRELEAEHLKIRVEGPAPSFYEKSLGKYQWQLVIKANERQELIKVIKMLPANWSYNIDPVDLL